MLDSAIALVLFIILMIIGYYFPHKSGWGALYIVPLLGPTWFTLLGSSIIPLNAYKIGFAISIGVFFKMISLSHYSFISLRNSLFFKILITYIAMIIFITVGELDELKKVLFTFIPNHFFAIILSFVLIKDQKSLEKLIRIYVWMGVIIAATVFIEFFTDYNIQLIIASTIPDWVGELPVKAKTSSTVYTRMGIYRASGLYGAPGPTGYMLSFLLPLAIWYAITKKGILIRYIPPILIFFAILFLMTRIVLISVAISFIVIMYYFLRQKNIRKYIARIIIAFLFISVVIITVYPQIIETLRIYFSLIIFDTINDTGQLGISDRFGRLSRALAIWWESPLWGQLVSPMKGYLVFMNSDDTPTPFLYLICGGIPLCAIYTFLYLKMPMDINRLFSIINIDEKTKLLIMFSCSAVIAGICNEYYYTLQTHIFMMYMLYIGFYNSFISKTNFV